MKIDILTLFPEMFSGFLNSSIIKRAIDSGILEVNLIDFREYSTNKHRKVDDYPYGGGAGMLLSVEPIHKALGKLEGGKRLLMSPQGVTLNHNLAKELSRNDHLVIVCGHYEGIDERVKSYIDLEVSIGDYVLTGGEISAMVVIDSVSRFIGSLGNDESHENDSFSNGLLEYPQYTRPAEFNGMRVPDVLLSGNHEEIRKYRRFESLKRTYLQRPDLLGKIELSKEDEAMLQIIRGAKHENN